MFVKEIKQIGYEIQGYFSKDIQNQKNCSTGTGTGTGTRTSKSTIVRNIQHKLAKLLKFPLFGDNMSIRTGISSYVRTYYSIKKFVNMNTVPIPYRR